MTSRLLNFLVLAFLIISSSCAATVQFAGRQDIQTSFQHLTGLAVADFNGDGFLDIAVTDDYANQITVYFNDGHGGFGAPVITTLTGTNYAGLGFLVSGDVNEDGKQDLIVAPIGGIQSDIVLLGKGDGTFTQGQVLTSTYGFSRARLVDVNGDKHLDLVSAGNPRISVELGDGKGNFTDSSIPSTETPTSFNTGLAIADFNRDGHLDLLTSAYNTFQIEFFSGNGDGTFAIPTTFTSNYFGTSGASLIAADFNGDGKQDFLASEDYSVFLAFGNGDGTFQLGDSQIVFPNLPYGASPAANGSTVIPIVAVGDMDLNGTPDIVAADDNASLLSVLLNDGTGKFQQATPDFTAAVDPGNGQIQLTDLNGDGLPDIVITNYKTQKISIFLSVIPKTTPTIILSSSTGQVLVGGSAMIAIQVKPAASHTPTGTVTLNSGSTSFGQQTLDASGQATLTLSNLAAGQYALTASYPGDKYNNGTTNATSFTEAVTDLQLALASSTQTIAAGGTATYNLTLTPVTGFSGMVSLSCSGLPAAYVCPSTSTNLTGQAVTVPFLVSPAPSVARSVPASDLAHRTQVALSWLGIAGLGLFDRKRRRPGLLAIALVSIATLTLVGCGNAPSAAPPYTGTSSFTITATATQGTITVSRQTTATLTVHQ